MTPSLALLGCAATRFGRGLCVPTTFGRVGRGADSLDSLCVQPDGVWCVSVWIPAMAFGYVRSRACGNQTRRSEPEIGKNNVAEKFRCNPLRQFIRRDSLFTGFSRNAIRASLKPRNLAAFHLDNRMAHPVGRHLSPNHEPSSFSASIVLGAPHGSNPSGSASSSILVGTMGAWLLKLALPLDSWRKRESLHAGCRPAGTVLCRPRRNAPPPPLPARP